MNPFDKEQLVTIGNNFEPILWRSTSANNCNSYMIDGPLRILIDPGHRAYFQHVEQVLRSRELTVADIDLVLCTHAHPDHIEAVQSLKAAGAKFGLHSAEWESVQVMAAHLSASFLETFEPDFFLQEGDLQLGDLLLQVLHTPGHSPGSVCFFSAVDGVLVTGDLIFKDGFGRTDLPGGDSRQLKASLQKVAVLPAQHILPGHGPVISGQEQVRINHERIGRLVQHYL